MASEPRPPLTLDNLPALIRQELPGLSEDASSLRAKLNTQLVNLESGDPARVSEAITWLYSNKGTDRHLRDFFGVAEWKQIAVMKPRPAVTVTVTAASSDCSRLDSDTRNAVQKCTGELKKLLRTLQKTSFAIGVKLLQVKARLAHGQFGDWLLAEFEMTPRHAQALMSIARQFPECEQHAHLFAPTALKALSAKSVPDAARQEALDLARAGTEVSPAVADRIVSRHTPGAKKRAGRPRDPGATGERPSPPRQTLLDVAAPLLDELLSLGEVPAAIAQRLQLLIESHS